jgi:hypothetical protein
VEQAYATYDDGVWPRTFLGGICSGWMILYDYIFNFFFLLTTGLPEQKARCETEIGYYNEIDEQ